MVIIQTQKDSYEWGDGSKRKRLLSLGPSMKGEVLWDSTVTDLIESDGEEIEVLGRVNMAEGYK